ncbi:MAG: hypothetical protein Q8P95_02675 [bacterium]|nr:hypothetical protein [bacterium]
MRQKIFSSTLTLTKKITSILLGLMMVSVGTFPALADVSTDCEKSFDKAITEVMGLAKAKEQGIRGAYQQLNDLLSTNTPTAQLIDEAAQLARNTRIELMGVCREVSKFDAMNKAYIPAYNLQKCAEVTNSSLPDQAPRSALATECYKKANEQIDGFLETMGGQLLRSGVRTSTQPLTQRMRSLNARLTTLLSEYSRLIQNFFAFNNRLGDTITGERD